MTLIVLGKKTEGRIEPTGNREMLDPPMGIDLYLSTRSAPSGRLEKERDSHSISCPRPFFGKNPENLFVTFLLELGSY